jgi:hypothetical protein
MVDFNYYIPPRLREPLRQARGLGYSLIDNVIGLDDGYESGGERLGTAIRQDPMGVARSVGGSLLESVGDTISDPLGAIQGVAQGIGQSYSRASQGAAAYLPEGVELKDATMEQIRMANDAYLADVTNLASVVPATKAVGSAGRTAMRVGRMANDAIGADAIGLARAVAQGDLEGVGEVFQRSGEGGSVGAKILRDPVRGYDQEEIARLEANVGLRDDKGRAKPEALEAMASQFDASGNRISNIRPDAKTGLTNMHPAANVRMNTPIEEQKVVTKTRGEANPRREVKLKVGDALVAAFGDRAVADTDILGYSGRMLDNPQSMLGGSGYIRDAKNDRIWASDEEVTKPILASLERAAEQGFTPRLIYTAMGAQASDFATDQLLRDYIRGVDIDPALRQVLADRLVASKDFNDKNFPMEDLISGGNSRRNMVGLLDGVEDYFDTMTGTNRRAVWQALDNSKFRDAGIPIGEARIAQTDPDLLYANPFDTGLNIGTPVLGSSVSPQSFHNIYPTGILGEYYGSTATQIPAAITFREFFNSRRGLREGINPTSPASDQRSFLMSHKNIISPVDQQMVDEIGQFEEYWRRFNR